MTQAGAAGEMIRNVADQAGGFIVPQRPEAADHGVGAGLEESPSEAHDTFALEYRPARRAAGGEDHRPPGQIELGDLARLQQPVLPLVTASEQHRGALRLVLVDDRVGGQVEDREVAKPAGLQQLLARGVAVYQPAVAAEPFYQRASIRDNVLLGNVLGSFSGTSTDEDGNVE